MAQRLDFSARVLELNALCIARGASAIFGHTLMHGEACALAERWLPAEAMRRIAAQLERERASEAVRFSLSLRWATAVAGVVLDNVAESEEPSRGERRIARGRGATDIVRIRRFAQELDRIEEDTAKQEAVQGHVETAKWRLGEIRRMNGILKACWQRLGELGLSEDLMREAEGSFGRLYEVYYSVLARSSRSESKVEEER